MNTIQTYTGGDIIAAAEIAIGEDRFDEVLTKIETELGPIHIDAINKTFQEVISDICGHPAFASVKGFISPRDQVKILLKLRHGLSDIGGQEPDQDISHRTQKATHAPLFGPASEVVFLRTEYLKNTGILLGKMREKKYFTSEESDKYGDDELLLAAGIKLYLDSKKSSFRTRDIHKILKDNLLGDRIIKNVAGCMPRLISYGCVQQKLREGNEHNSYILSPSVIKWCDRFQLSANENP